MGIWLYDVDAGYWFGTTTVTLLEQDFGAMGRHGFAQKPSQISRRLRWLNTNAH